MDQSGISEGTLRDVVRACVGKPEAVIERWRVEPVVDVLTNFATAALVRVSGIACGGGARLPWSLVVKRVQSLRHSPGLALIPEEMRESNIASYPWRSELDAYRSDLATLLPAGLRAPVVYLIEEHDDDRATMWMEDVATDPAAVWDLDRYARAAALLGRMAARRRPADVSGYEPAEGTRRFCEAALLPGMIPALRDPAMWRHPLLATAADPSLRGDLLRLADELPGLLAALRALPQTFVHGDACPQNLLIPVADPEGFVAIDWFWSSGVEPVGFDLGQLLAGGCEAGWLDPRQLASVYATILPPYIDGLHAEGFDADPRDVELGFVGPLVMRSAFTSLPLDLLAAEPTDELRERFAQRARYARFLTDLGLALPLAA